MREQTTKDLLVFSLLVTIGVVGRLAQPEVCVTPIAATGLLAGYLFRRPVVAALVPLTAMLISDLMLPGYQAFGVMLAVYAALASSALLGAWLRKGSGVAWLGKLTACSLLPATVFFLTSNFAVWAWSTAPYYEKSAAGMVHCYTMALPFFARMMTGDMAFTALLFGAALAAGAMSRQAAPQREAA